MDFLIRQTRPLLWLARERLAAFVNAEPRYNTEEEIDRLTAALPELLA